MTESLTDPLGIPFTPDVERVAARLERSVRLHFAADLTSHIDGVSRPVRRVPDAEFLEKVLANRIDASGRSLSDKPAYVIQPSTNPSQELVDLAVKHYMQGWISQGALSREGVISDSSLRASFEVLPRSYARTLSDMEKEQEAPVDPAEWPFMDGRILPSLPVRLIHKEVDGWLKTLNEGAISRGDFFNIGNLTQISQGPHPILIGSVELTVDEETVDFTINARPVEGRWFFTSNREVIAAVHARNSPGVLYGRINEELGQLRADADTRLAAIVAGIK